jgi:SAM-dependent methyltransferase
MQQVIDHFEKKDFWSRENLIYDKPNFRLRKCARFINELAGDRQCALLDVGCGPAALRGLLESNVDYYGIDIAIHSPAPWLVEKDFVENPICYGDKRFDLVVALGVFEYLNGYQDRKLAEIAGILKAGGGKAIVSYLNFNHFRRILYPAYNNIRSVGDFKASLARVFEIDRWFPVSHHWRHKQPGKNALPALQMRLNRQIPFMSSWLAVEYLFICSLRAQER